MAKELYTVFEYEKYDGKLKRWIKDHSFYMGDVWLDVNDWRFSEVKGRRTEAKLLGCANVEFPVQYPLILINGLVIEKPNEITYDLEDE